MDFSNFLPKIYEVLTIYGIKVIAALAIFVVGRWVVKGLTGLIRKALKKSGTEPTLISFVTNLSYFTLLIFVIIAAVNQLGIQTTSFVAVLGAAGLAVGFALKDSLSNFAAGVMMIIFRPFKSDDFIEAAGVAGTVEKIQIFTTQLKTPDNKTIIVPNAKVLDDNITNYTVKGTRRVDMTFGIGYDDDIDRSRAVIQEILARDDRVMKDPAPLVAVSELADSSVNFVVRVWTSADDYWPFYFDMLEKVKKRFDAEGISIPFPQRDVHVYAHTEKESG